MTKESKALQEALLDAKAIQDTAVELARLSISESLTPQIKQLLSAKLQEDLSQEEGEGSHPEEMDEAAEESKMKAMIEKMKKMFPELSLEKIKAFVKDELSASSVKPGGKYADKGYASADHGLSEEESKKEEEEEGKEEQDEAFDIDSALNEIEKSQVKENDDEDSDDEEDKKPEDSDDAAAGDDAATEYSDAEAEGELDEEAINKLLAEMEDEEEEEGKEDKEEMDEDSQVEDQGEEGKEEMDESAIKDILDKIKKLPAHLKKKWDTEYSAKAIKGGAPHSVLPSNLEEKEMEDEEEGKEEMDETKKLLELKKTLMETNLLNAKLLYQNKLLASGHLSEAQQARMIQAFDKAKTVNEVKLIFETLEIKKTQKPSPRTTVSESLGFKFKPTEQTKQNLSEGKNYDETDPAVLAMMRRAGIKK